MEPDQNILTEAECTALLDRMFPAGPGGADVQAALGALAEGEHPLAERVTIGLWDVFSDNHDVRDRDGRIAHLGSFRGSGGFLAEWLDARGPDGAHHNYMDFYMGSLGAKDAGTHAIHRLIFARLRAIGGDWRYAFPRLLLIEFGPPLDAYDPATAFAREQERSELRAKLDDAHREAVESARTKPPPPIVAAYRTVFGHDPEGWPPEFEPDP